jgi:hypothetical protein
MWRNPSALKLSSQLIFSILGLLLLGIALLHAGRTLLVINLPAKPTASSNRSMEQAITKALDLVSTQTSSD